MIVGYHSRNTGQVQWLWVDTQDDDWFRFGAEDRSGVETMYYGYATDSCLGYLGGVVEGEVTRVVMYWVPV